MIAVLWVMAILAPLPYVEADREFFFQFHPGKAFCAHDIESLLKGYGAFLVLFYITISFSSSLSATAKSSSPFANTMPTYTIGKAPDQIQLD